jgi:Cu/Ag efflux protein CusF
MFFAGSMKCIVSVLLASGLTVATAAAASDDTKRVVVEVPGKLKKLDLEQGVVTLLLGDEDDVPRREEQFSLAGKDIPVTGESGEKLQLAEIKLGYVVRLGLSEMDEVVQILVQSPRQKGTIKAVDLEQKILTVYVGTKGPELKFKFAPVMRLEMENEPLALHDLFAGMRVTLFLSLDQKTVHRVVASVRFNSGEVYWGLINVDPAAHTVQLMKGYKGTFKVVTYPVAKDFHFVFQKKMHKIKLDDLTGVKGFEGVDRALPVWVLLDETQKTIVTIVANSPKISGVVQKVDPKARTLSVKTEAGVEIFAVTQDTLITPKARKLMLADIEPGTHVDLHLGYNRSEVVIIAAQVKDDE